MNRVPVHPEQERTKRDRIERLRTRLAKVRTNPMGATDAMVDIIKGILDLLEDEL